MQASLRRILDRLHSCAINPCGGEGRPHQRFQKMGKSGAFTRCEWRSLSGQQLRKWLIGGCRAFIRRRVEILVRVSSERGRQLLLWKDLSAVAAFHIEPNAHDVSIFSAKCFQRRLRNKAIADVIGIIERFSRQ